MNTIFSIAKKDLRLLFRDPKAAIILLVMPLAFMLVLGVSLGEDRVRVSIVNEDDGDWSAEALKDLKQAAGIEVELLESREEAERLVRGGRRAAVLIFGPNFSKRIEKCSFLEDGINPFYHDGVYLHAVDATIIRDDTQLMSASIIEQVAQGSLLRVVLPWMVGQAFGEIGRPTFIHRLSKQKKLDVDLPFEEFIELLINEKDFDAKIKVPIPFAPPISARKVFASLDKQQKKNLAKGMAKAINFQRALNLFNDKQKAKLANGMQDTLQELFKNYDLTARDWTGLTKSKPSGEGIENAARAEQVIGNGLLRRGAIRYQKVVPSSVVMFAFFLVLIGGWLFVGERRQGTMKRLSAAPVTRLQILLGKLLPVFTVSVFQGLFLLGAGKLVFNMSWGANPGLLVVVVVATSFAAMGMALLIAALAKTETQVAIYGMLLVLLLAGLSGALMGDRSMMPETMETLSRITPHAWALDAYQQLLLPPGEDGSLGQPNLTIIAWSCGVLAMFGLGFLGLAWCGLRLE